MRIEILKSKIHRATITDADLGYEGSISIDGALLEKAGIWPFERVLVANLSTGVRFETYVIEAENHSGRVALNGGAARLGVPGDLVIIMAFGTVPVARAAEHMPRMIRVDAQNRPRE